MGKTGKTRPRLRAFGVGRPGCLLRKAPGINLHLHLSQLTATSWSDSTAVHTEPQLSDRRPLSQEGALTTDQACFLAQTSWRFKDTGASSQKPTNPPNM